MEEFKTQKLSSKFQEGQVILVDKPYTWTSFDVVGKIRYHLKKELGLKKLKVGHAGTLDPLATGLLVVCTGKFTKQIEQIQALQKEYTGVITLGAITASYDLEKPVTMVNPIGEVENTVLMDCAKSFVGEQKQKAPMYSAKKVDGKRAYEVARKGEELVLKENDITIYDFEVGACLEKLESESTNLKTNQRINVEPIYQEGLHVPFRIACSKGTYIRSIARDFGLALNSGGHLSKLRRTKIGNYSVENAIIPSDENVLALIKGS